MNHTRRPPSSDLHAPMMVLDFAADAMPGQRLLFTHAHTVELAWQANEVLPALADKVAPGGVVLAESEREAALPERAGALVLAKQYYYGKIMVSRYEKEEQA